MWDEKLFRKFFWFLWAGDFQLWKSFIDGNFPCGENSLTFAMQSLMEVSLLKKFNFNELANYSVNQNRDFEVHSLQESRDRLSKLFLPKLTNQKE